MDRLRLPKFHKDDLIESGEYLGLFEGRTSVGVTMRWLDPATATFVVVHVPWTQAIVNRSQHGDDADRLMLLRAAYAGTDGAYRLSRFLRDTVGDRRCFLEKASPRAIDDLLFTGAATHLLQKEFIIWCAAAPKHRRQMLKTFLANCRAPRDAEEIAQNLHLPWPMRHDLHEIILEIAKEEAEERERTASKDHP